MSFFTNRRQSDSDTDKQPPKPIPQHPVGFETVLGTGSAIDGTLTCKGNIRLDGDFTGTLDIQGNVLVGETAKINADIEARNISIAGAVRGNITGNKVQLLRTGRIWGDITANALTTEEGAFIDGKITMKSHSASTPDTPDKVEEEVDADAVETEPVAIQPDVELMDDKPTQPFERPPDPDVSDPDEDTMVDRPEGLVDASTETEAEDTEADSPDDTEDDTE